MSAFMAERLFGAVKKGRVGYSEVTAAASGPAMTWGGDPDYPQKLWINLWNIFERVP